MDDSNLAHGGWFVNTFPRLSLNIVLLINMPTISIFFGGTGGQLEKCTIAF